MSVAISSRPSLAPVVSSDIVVMSRDGTNLGRATVAELLTSVNLPGNPTTTTQSTGNSSTRVATTAYVKNNLANYGALATNNTWLSGQKFGDGVGSSDIRVNGGVGTVRRILFESAGDPRLEIGISNDAESGSDVGSVAYLYTYNDAGVPDLVTTIARDGSPWFINRELDIIKQVSIQPGAGPALVLGGSIEINTDQVLTDRQTGWSAATGTLSRAALDGSSATLAQTREALAALITDLTTHGLIGA